MTIWPPTWPSAIRATGWRSYKGGRQAWNQRKAIVEEIEYLVAQPGGSVAGAIASLQTKLEELCAKAAANTDASPGKRKVPSWKKLSKYAKDQKKARREAAEADAQQALGAMAEEEEEQ